ncbi:hypothetical protein BU14_0229s0018 [Porphyra umbilicalis]|uniref:Up-frameshift suppressor 2 C-terminal domain-containing protein n=1 Tax=Porphyra umbilicalis TaxID=2786 RepID=A0A1X6P4F1_PORUM|nr:hypothetical protein BU14_0229s0018 [Porphyra umbilicalis]|eukprot:OSX75630.1 hypothetical protein BU14_0229s0018 [Porphyra umbilicalis]
MAVADLYARLPLHVRFVVEDGLASVSGGSLPPRARSLANAVAAVERVESTPALAAMVKVPNYALPPVPVVAGPAPAVEAEAAAVMATATAPAATSPAEGAAASAAAPAAKKDAPTTATSGVAVDKDGSGAAAAASTDSVDKGGDARDARTASGGSDASPGTSVDGHESDDHSGSGADVKDGEEYEDDVDEDVESNGSDELDDPDGVEEVDDEEGDEDVDEEHEEGEVDDEDDDDDDHDDDDDEEDEDDDEDDDEDVELTNVPQKVVRTEEEEEFDRELAAVQKEATNEAWQQAKGSSASVNRMSLPLRLFAGSGTGGAAAAAAAASDSGGDGSGDAPPPDTVDVNGVASVKLKLLVRKGGKSQSKEIAVPAASSLASAARDGDVAGRAEQLEVKRLVLGSAAVMSPDSDEERDDGGYGGRGGGGRNRRPERPQQYDERYLLTGMFKMKPR